MFRIAGSFTILFAVLCGAALPARAWDDTGHKITGYIAWQRMLPEVREKVVKTMLAAPEDAQLSTFYATYGPRTVESRRREFFMLATTWADIIRDRNFKTRFEKYAHSDWHYDDHFWEEKDGKPVMVAATEPGGQAVKKMNEFGQVIKSNASDMEKAIAIAWLEHLIGDIHQPLHTSARIASFAPKGDQGGNLFQLTPRDTPRADQVNLHWFWDSIVVRNQPNSKDGCEGEYIDPLAADIMKEFPYDKLRSRLNAGKFASWKDESFDIATSEVYKGVVGFQMPSEDYRKKAFRIARERLALAGYRMAELFNDAFAPAAPAPQPAAAK